MWYTTMVYNHFHPLSGHKQLWMWYTTIIIHDMDRNNHGCGIQPFSLMTWVKPIMAMVYNHFRS